MMYLSGLGRCGRIEKKRMPVKLVIDASVALKWQFKDSLNIGIELVDFAGLEEKTFKMARRHNRSVYNCAYLSLAERERCNIFTADKHLYNALNDKVPFIRWIGNYSSSHY